MFGVVASVAWPGAPIICQFTRQYTFHTLYYLHTIDMSAY